MPELLLHFIIPFFLLIFYGLSIKKSIFLSFFSIVPDLDVLFHYHYFLSHSFIFLALVTIPLLIFTYVKKRDIFSYVCIATTILFSHPILDMFNAYIPILYPLYNYSIKINCSLLVNINNLRDFTFIFAINKFLCDPSVPVSVDFNAPIFTSVGVIISLILLVGLILIKINSK